MLCVNIALAVRWHRYVILGEDDARFLAAPFGRRELRYFGKSLLVTIVAAGAMIMAMAVPFGIVIGIAASGADVARVVASLVLAIVAYLLALLVVARLGLVLPAVAIDREARLVTSWRLTRPHWWPFCLLLVLVGMPQILTMLVIETVLDEPSSTIWSATAVLFQEIVFLASVAAFAIALSSNYLAVARNVSDVADRPERD